ncbi:hypothetical protein [Parapedobacter tibetensis]|uniref:hypothetical protein n=1 Tax=Parapedobacter tibetensis TaxID=2972951 RepID=UPI00214D5399|nr:hypothetical protein [Parapedobacter tibetensis]
MNIQYLNDAKGRRTSVLVPLKEWDALNREREDLKRKLQEAELTLRFKKTLSDVQRYKVGKLKTRSVQTLLDEL